MAEELESCLAHFPENRWGEAHRARSLFDRAPSECLETSLRLLAQARLPAASEWFLLALLSSRQLQFQVLSRIHAHSKERTRELCLQFQKVDYSFAAALVERLVHCLQDPARAGTEEVLVLLECASTVKRIGSMGPALQALREAAPPRLRARAATIGAGQPDGKRWLETFRHDRDPRVRANAVEALWGAPEETALPVFLQGRNDTHHRVRANALVGLYYLGDQRSLAGLVAMGRASAPLSRAAARWAMAHLGDPRFSAELARLNAEFPGRQRPGEAPASPCEPVGIEVEILRCSVLPGDDRGARPAVRAAFLAIETDFRMVPALRPIDVLAWWNGAPLFEYEFSRPIGRRATAAVACLPAPPGSAETPEAAADPVVQAFANLPGDSWRACGFYRAEEPHSVLPVTGRVSVERAGPKTGVRLGRIPPLRQDRAGFLSDLAQSLAPESISDAPATQALAFARRLAALRVPGCLIVRLADLESRAIAQGPVEELGAVSRENRLTIHVLAPGEPGARGMAWLELAEMTGGSWNAVASPDGVRGTLERLLLRLEGEFTVTFPVEDRSGELRLEVRHRGRSGAALRTLVPES